MPKISEVIYTVYENPNDYPGQFVVRRWMLVPGESLPICDEQPLCVNPSYAVAIACLPPGLTRIARDEMDEPAIRESWL